MANSIPSVTLSNGFSMPGIGYGTYLATDNNCEEAVKNAIDVGYRHIDTASFYENEKEIGNALRSKIKNGDVTREELFITTKLWNNCHKQERVVPSLKKSLEDLGLDYVDLYLIHWPFAFKDGDDVMPTDDKGNTILSDTDYLETWKGMEECVELGLTRSIGISNFNSQQISRLVNAANIKPVNNQIEVSVNLNQEALIQFCQKHNIVVTGYSPLGRPGNYLGIPTSLDNPKLIDIAKKYNKTAAQIAIRYVHQQGAIPLPKTVTKSRMIENIQIFDFELTNEEMNVIKSIGNGERVAPFTSIKNHQYYPFSIPF